MNCGEPVRRSSTHLKIGVLQFHSEMQVENFMILLALSWWKSQGALRFPHLAKLAKKYLYIPATSAPSERVWSRAPNILTIRRARMSDTVAESIMFTKENSRILCKHYTAMTGLKYVPHLPFVYEDSIEDSIGEDVDED